jgi:hypothetical protein
MTAHRDDSACTGSVVRKPSHSRKSLHSVTSSARPVAAYAPRSDRPSGIHQEAFAGFRKTISLAGSTKAPLNLPRPPRSAANAGVDVRISQKPVSTFPAAAPRPGAADLRAAAARVRLSRRGDGRRRLAGIGVCRFRDGPWPGFGVLLNPGRRMARRRYLITAKLQASVRAELTRARGPGRRILA